MEKVLKLLLEAQGGFLSGEKMSQILGVSRTAVWKSVNRLKEKGYHIESVPNKGYCLRNLSDKLDAVQLSLGMEGLPFYFDCHESIDSTNNEVKRQAMNGAKEGLVVVAEEQVAGKGRRGRSFHSPSGTGLYFSLLLRPSCKVEQLTPLTAWVAVAVAEGIEAHCGLSPEIKWCNDLVLGGKKISGILTELSIESESGFVEFVVVGIGINVNHSTEDFPEELQDFTSSLYEQGGQLLCRNALCREILFALNRMYSCFFTENRDYLENYRQRCLTVGKEVQVHLGEEITPALAVEIDEEFRLVVQYSDGSCVPLSGGEVSVRGMYGYI